MQQKKVTIREVAALAGVSISSVSRYLADPKSVQPLAAYNIKNAIRELRYEPNIFAQNLRKGKTKIIGMVVPHMEYFFARVCRVASDYFFEREFITFICESNNDGEKEKAYMRELLSQKAAGIIIAPSGQNTSYLQDITADYKNIVAIDRMEEIGCDIVSENHWLNSYQLMLWLLKNKMANQILLLFGWQDSFNTKMCMAGSNQALKENGVAEERVHKVQTAREAEAVALAIDQLKADIKPGERALIVAFGTDILEYVVMVLHGKYRQWMKNVDIAGFAQAGTAEKLGIPCSLVIKNPEEVAVTASELLYHKIMEENKAGKAETIPRKYEVKVNYQFF